MNALGPDVLEIVRYVVEEAPFAGLILCGTRPHFSVGADLKYIAHLVAESNFTALQSFLVAFQHAITSLKSAPFPVVAAVRGLSLGGGYEFALAADARVIAAETRMGLVETRVGLVPAGGGVMEMARRTDADHLLDTFNTIYAGDFSDNAFQARNWRLLAAADSIELADDLLLEKAIKKLQYMLDSHYVAAEQEPIAVLGSSGIEQIETQLDIQRAEGKLSEHDGVVGRGLARILCARRGAARVVNAAEILELEREVFLQLCGMEATRQRIAHMLKTGKPLKN
jgi:3-hydroxyacyl-CoA dehydrogenase